MPGFMGIEEPILNDDNDPGGNDNDPGGNDNDPGGNDNDPGGNDNDNSGNMEVKTKDGTKDDSNETNNEFRLYPRRWGILLLFCLCSMTNSFQWAEYVIIVDPVKYYYNDSLPTDENQKNIAIAWTSMIYMLTYIPFVFFFAWFVAKFGLRWCAIMANVLNTIGTWIKVASVRSDLFPVAFVGQTFTGTAQSFILGVPAYQAAIWFGSNELSMATAFGVFGNQLGVGLGFLIPPLLVHLPTNSKLTREETMENMTRGWYFLLVGIASISTVLLVLILIFYRKAPPTPPSRAQLALKEQLSTESSALEYSKSLRALITNRNYVLILLSYGFNTGTYYAIGTLLNLILLDNAKTNEAKKLVNEHVGQIGLTFVLTGLLGSILAGLCLDRWRKYKLTTFVIYACCFVLTLVYTFTLQLGSIALNYVTIGAMGFFMTGYLPIGFEFAAEITYPVPEGTSTGLLNCMAQVFGVLLTFIGSSIVEKNSLYFNGMCCVLLGIGMVMNLVVKEDLRRQRAGTNAITDAGKGANAAEKTTPDRNQVSPSPEKTKAEKC